MYKSDENVKIKWKTNHTKAK